MRLGHRLSATDRRRLAMMYANNNGGANLRQALLDGAPIALPLTHTVIGRGGLTPSFTRATTETGQKYDEAGYLDFTALSGEAIFTGAMRIYNEWTTSSVSLANLANKSLTLAAGTYQFSMGAGTGTATFSGTGGATGTLGASVSGRVSVAKTITAGTFVVTASVADLADLQVCNITGETDQTTIRPYVSVGVASAPAYHGSMVDGVKCYDTDRSGNPIPTSGSYPLVGYVPWEARTNSLLHARDLSNAAWVKVNCTGVKDAVGSDGVTNSASTMTATGANATVLQTIVLAAAARSYSVKLKRKTGSGTVSICRDGVTFTDITAQINSSTYTTVKIENTSVLNPVCGIKLATSGDAVYVDWNQDEAGAFITPAINTTTVAVARNSNLLTYTGADVSLLKTLACTFAYPAVVNSATNYTVIELDDGSLTSNSVVMRVLGDQLKLQTFTYSGTVAQSSSTHTNALSSANHKCAITWPTNGIISDVDGGDFKTDAVNTPPVGLTTLRVGNNSSSNQHNNGPVNHIYGWTRNLSQSELGAVDRA